MEYRPLGNTGIRVSAIAFGAGPAPALLTKGDADAQRATVERALRSGINWFDTAATYGNGQSERNLGRALSELDAWSHVYLATKVRVPADRLHDIRGFTLDSVEKSLARLGAPRVALVQIHNSITRRRDDEPTSIEPRDVLGPGGMLEALRELQASGHVGHIGLTGLGHAETLRETLDSGAFASAQVVYNLLNRTAADPAAATPGEANYARLLDMCAQRNVGAFAIRVFAGGALADRPPSEHTLTTKFFPLDLYERDRARARALANRLPKNIGIERISLRFVLDQPRVTAALVGFSSPVEVDEAVRYAESGPLDESVLGLLHDA